ncbi:MAG: hypothetical protein JWO13_2218 [Acidobacteriales bacterium]|nr:hypothetical protein [Terriglobales bacterium]
MVNQSGNSSKSQLWLGRVISGLCVLFFLADTTAHFMKPAPVVQAFEQLGIPVRLSVTIALIQLACIILYVVPRTRILGMVLITGYLGGAVAIHLRAGSATFPVVFPILLGAAFWTGPLMRDQQLCGFVFHASKVTSTRQS